MNASFVYTTRILSNTLIGEFDTSTGIMYWYLMADSGEGLSLGITEHDTWCDYKLVREWFFQAIADTGTHNIIQLATRLWQKERNIA